jgi:hypothetical protein
MKISVGVRSWFGGFSAPVEAQIAAGRSFR